MAWRPWPALGLALLGLLLLVNLPARSAELLTAEERAWLQVHGSTIRYAPCSNYPPYDFLDAEGQPSGLMADYMRLLEQRLGCRFQRVTGLSWDDILRQAQTRQIDVLGCATPTPERRRFLTFTTPLFSNTRVIIMRDDPSRHERIEDLKGHRIAAGKGYSVASQFRERYPDITLVDVVDDEAGLTQTAMGTVDGVLTDLGTATWVIHKRQLTGLRSGPEVLDPVPNCLAVRSDWPELARILDRGLNSLTLEERQALEDKWIASIAGPPSLGRIIKYMLLVAMPLAVLLGLALLWSRSLKRLVTQRTRQLEEQNTELRIAEGRLRESEAFRRRIFDSSRVPVVVMDAVTLRFIDCNPAAVAIYRLPSREATVGKLPLEVSAPKQYDGTPSATKAQTYIDAALRDGSVVFEWRHQRADGELWDAEVHLMRFELDDRVLLQFTLQNITERKRAEEALRESEVRYRAISELYHALFDLAPCCIVLISPDEGRIVEYNSQAAALLGYTHAEFARLCVADIEALEQRHEVQQHLARIITYGHDTFETRLRSKAGQAVAVIVTARTMRSDGKPHILAAWSDLTEHQRVQEVLIETEKMMTVAGLAAGMAHEINNPLGIIAQAAQNIERRVSPELPANQQVAAETGVDLTRQYAYFQRRAIPQFIADIREASERAAKIVTNMLQFSRKSNVVKQPAQLAELLDRAVELAASDYDLKKKYDFRGVEIVREYQADLPAVEVAPVEIEQVLLNLLKNAAQAMIANPPERRPRIVLQLKRSDHYLVMTVADNGCGMAEAVRRRVFEPFFTTKEPGVGTGLGLSVSYAIVTQNHGGQITVDSAPGAGARFSIRLPLKPGNPP